MKYFFWGVMIFSIYSCGNSKTTAPKEQVTISQQWLDSIKKSSDTIYSKPYRNNEFVSSDYYINRQKGITCQVMRDSAGVARQVIIVEKAVRIFTGEYYANGQLKAKLPLDSTGRYDGAAKFYYESGIVKSEGSFRSGFYSGNWKNYKENGTLVSTDQYNENGQLVKSVPQ
jgi:antitoxin component YwqK of YwqJK toxin-antitoxin module